MEHDLARLASTRRGLVTWQELRARGWSESAIQRAIRAGILIPIHNGVYAVGHRPSDPLARFLAATMTEPGTVLTAHSALVHFGLRREQTSRVVVARAGSGGIRHDDGLTVMRSTTLSGETTEHLGIPTVTPVRAIIDMAPRVGHGVVDRLVRDAIRLELMTSFELRASLAKHRGRRGTRVLQQLLTTYEALAIERTKSNAEVQALVLSQTAGRRMPLVNIDVEGEEADLVWPDLKRIIELDGPQFHLFKELDARKQAIWEAGGWQVDRLVTDVVFDTPWHYLDLAP